MQHEAFWHKSSDNTPLYVNHWFGQQPPKAIVMLAHGMAEHSSRYARFGETLVANGFELYAHDQRGHGKTAENGVLGHYADSNGWNLVVSDLACINHLIRHQHAQVPIFLFGHSMGSYIAQAYLMQHSSSVHGVVLSGSNYQPVALYKSARAIARFEAWRQGPTGHSALINFLSFGSFNKTFKPNRTGFDWLSRDPDEVDKYVNDPLCGFRCSNQLWLDLLAGLQAITPRAKLAQIEPNLPFLIIGGARDPVSQGKRLANLAGALKEAGKRHVALKIYPEARHELLNESNRDEVCSFIIEWLEQTLGQPHPFRSEIQEIH